MPSLTDVRTAVCSLLSTALTDALRVEALVGDVDMSSLAKKNVPYGKGLVFVAIGEAVNVGRDNLDFDMAAAFAVFTIARNATRITESEDCALLLAQRAALAIHGGVFGLAGVSPARVTGIAPVEDEGDTLEKLGMRVWCVTFEQRIVFI